MNAILLALTLTGVVILDYSWEHFESRLKDKKSAAVFKWLLICILLLAGWAQAILQYRRDSQSDKDSAYLKQQLALANTSLTNSTATVKGLTTGGDYLPDVSFSQGLETNTIRFTLMSQSEYPLRDLYVKVTDKTDQAYHSNTNVPSVPAKVVFERFFGDYPASGWADVGTATLKPYGTNFIRIDINALNGTCWEIFHITKTNENWAVRLFYRWKQLSGHKPEIDPPAMHGILVVD